MPTKIQGGLGIDKVQDGTVGLSDVDTELYGRFFGNLNFQSYMYVRDEKPSGTVSGTSSSTTWHKRDLNAVKANTIDSASLAANAITLPAGKYYIKASAPALRATRHVLRVLDSNLNTVLNGRNSYTSSTDPVVTFADVRGVFELNTLQSISLSHYIETGFASEGLGVTCSITGINEVYSEVEIWKIG